MTEPAGAPGGAWLPDPTGRHDHRWWNGASWTEQVADGGVAGSDPLQPALPPPDAGLGLGSGLLTVAMNERAYGHWPVLDAAGTPVGWAIRPRHAGGPPAITLTDDADRPLLRVQQGQRGSDVLGPDRTYGQVGIAPMTALGRLVATVVVRGTVRGRLMADLRDLIARPVPLDSVGGGALADLQVGRFEDGVGWLALRRRTSLSLPLDALVLALPLAVALEMAGRVALRGGGRHGETPGSPWPGL